MGAAWIAIAALLWATIGPVARFALRSGVDPLEISFWRAVIGGVLFLGLALARRQRRVAARDLPAVIAFAALGIMVFYWSYFRAVQEGGAALAAILLYTAPAWVAVAAAIWLRERITPRRAGAIALTLAGIALVASGTTGDAGGRNAAAGVLWGLLSGIAYASHYLFGKRYFPRYDASMLFAHALPVGALMLLPLVPFGSKTPTDWLVLGYLAAVPTFGAYLLYARGLRRIDASHAATVATLEPVAAAAFAWLVWDEVLGGWGYVGAVLVVGGVLLASTRANGDRGGGVDHRDAGVS